MNILITGGNGYIGKSLNKAFKNKYNITLLNRQIIDLTSSQSVINYFNNKYFDIVIHCAVVGGSRLKEDTWKELDTNLIMYYNLLQCSSNYNKFIHFGSGAELYTNNKPYGLSKDIIAKSISIQNNFYNIRIFGVFDENELDTRFIKFNLKNYINKKPMNVLKNKFMDFFYMEDLINLVDYYIINNDMQKEINCSYKEKYTLEHISEIINTLDSYKVEIDLFDNNNSQFYIGQSNLPIKTIGLEEGIKNTFRKLKQIYS